VSRARWLLPLGLALLSSGSSGCAAPGGPGGGPGPVFCLASLFPDPDAGSPPIGAGFTLVVGSEDAARDRVGTGWHDGDHVALVAGAQGGFMIRPALDVTAPAPLSEDGAHATCLGVRMIAGAPADAAPVVTGAMAPRVAGTVATYHVSALFGLLTFSRKVDGATIPLAFDVLAPADGGGHADLTVIPDATLSP
jgi:hypothetical protein